MSFAGFSLETAMRRTCTWSAWEPVLFVQSSGYLLSIFACGIDARGDRRNVLSQLLRALRVDVHIFGHGGCSSLRSRV